MGVPDVCGILERQMIHKPKLTYLIDAALVFIVCMGLILIARSVT